MKFNIISDTHCEFWGGNNHLPGDYPNLILAGDISEFHFDKYSRKYSHKGDYGLRKKSLLWIAGNHEYYGTNLDACYVKPGTLIIETNDIKVKIIHATLWTDPHPQNDWLIQTNLNDFSMITRGLNQPFTVDYMKRLHLKELDYIYHALKEPWDGKKIVVTHHVPHGMFIHEKWKDSAIGEGWYSDALEHIDLDYWPDVWCFGHMHEPFDDVVHGTRFICNPFGYFGHGGGGKPKEFEV